MKKYLFILFLIAFFSLSAQEQKKDSIPKWKILGCFSFTFNQSSFTNWSSGSQSIVAGNININYDFNFKKNKINWDTKILTGYGLSYLSEKGARKTDDRFELNSLIGLKTNKFWFLSFFTNFKTQYSKGFNYQVTPVVSVSDFLSPAYLSFGPGILYKKSDNFSLNIAPATTRFIFVNDLFSGNFGVEKGKNMNFSLGFNFSSYSKFLIMKNIELENTLAIYSNYLNKPQNIYIENQLNINFTVNEYIQMQMTFHGIFDDNTSGKLQFRQLFGLGVNYNFHEKISY